MKYHYIPFIAVLTIQLGFSQQYDSVIIEEDSMDANNQVYKVGNVYVFDYEILENGSSKKLKTNSRQGFELLPSDSDSLGVEKIHLIVKPSEDASRTNPNQTEISYLQAPQYGSLSSTGAVDNDKNVWIHPIREGFFQSLETCPFPYIKMPLQIGSKWEDAMIIGDGWSNEVWGTWSGQLLLEYQYEITGKEILKTPQGAIECFSVESTATSTMGVTTLKSFYSEAYGFIRLEYVLWTGMKVNLWVVDFMQNKEFNDTRTFFKTKEYIKQ